MEIIYEYDGSFDGFLCCIFESYAQHEVPIAMIRDEDFEPTFYATRTVSTDKSHAGRVFRKIVKLSPPAMRLLRRGFLTCMEEKELHLYHLVVKLLREGPGFLQNCSDETGYPVWKAVRFLDAEVEKLRGFVRFSELGGVLGSEIEPKNWVLPILRGHFCSRYQNETFFIYDRTHHEVLFYTAGKSEIMPLEYFQMAPPDEMESKYRMLWKRFYNTIAIKERYNPKCRMSHLPKRYWNTMTEFQPEDPIMVKNSPAGVPVPGVPSGRSVPEIPPESAQSAPVSSL